MRPLHLVTAGLMAALLVACGASPKERYYTLTPESGAPVTGTSALSVAVGPVSVPEAVDQPQIVAQVGANQVAMYEYSAGRARSRQRSRA